jgi:hypothetical protein
MRGQKNAAEQRKCITFKTFFLTIAMNVTLDMAAPTRAKNVCASRGC